MLTSVSCQSQTDFVKVDKTKVDKEEFELVKNLTDKIITAQKNGGYYSLTENEAAVQMIEGLNESVQKESYGKIKNLFGDYKDLNFESLMESPDGNKYRIYRFKGNFERNSDNSISPKRFLRSVDLSRLLTVESRTAKKYSPQLLR